MDMEHIKVELKHHWPLVVGGLVGVYVLVHYGSALFGGRNNNGGGTVDNTAALASMAATGAAASAQNQSYTLATNQLAAQSTAATQAAQVSGMTAMGNAVSSIGDSIATVIAAQSVLPATAINAASAGHQMALSAAAGVAAEGIKALPGMLTGEANLITASFSNMKTYGATLIGLGDNFAALGVGSFNAIAGSSNGSTGAAGGSAAAGAAANAKATEANDKMMASMASSAAMMMV